MTKVLLRNAALWIGLALSIAMVNPTLTVADEAPMERPAESLYLRLGSVGLDASRVYKVRGASLDRSAIHITLEDGTIAFTEDVMGRTTGAFFSGDGEVLLSPPNAVERKSMSFFTGMAILEEHFASAYFRFNDDVESEMRPDLRHAEEKQPFVDRFGSMAQNLASTDAMRLLVSFSTLVPSASGNDASPKLQSSQTAKDQFFHARLQGTNLGVFDVIFDSRSGEQIEVGQGRQADNGNSYYDVWTSFSPVDPGTTKGMPQELASEKQPPERDWIRVLRYSIVADVEPPKEIHARAQLECEVHEGGSRVLVFELSRFLRIESITLDGSAVEFVHNPSIEGTQLSRRGNDTVAVILPELARTHQKFSLEFVYGGDVLQEAGSGLLYVGERGTWYPNRGLIMANFDLQFDYPPGWTLVATGKREPPIASSKKIPGMQESRWVSDRPIPVAGFNLGKYKSVTAQADNITVEAYATVGVEKTFPNAPIQATTPGDTVDGREPPRLIVPERPSPAMNERAVAETAAGAVHYFGERFGPFPYSRLSLTQLPGNESQGWPGLIFLSSYAFLNQQEREQLHFSPEQISIQELIPAHETAHQWWGDLVSWNSYRDQWISEGLANYCALMMLQARDPASFHRIMEKYRQDLLQKDKDGNAPKDAGPVTLGIRLLSSRAPDGYEAISYGRATWLFHMLRTMLDDAHEVRNGKTETVADEPFARSLRRVRERFEGKSITTSELLSVFAEDLPSGLQYEGHRSLDWFLEGWVNGTSVPQLQLRNVKITTKGSGVIATGNILQKEAPFDLVTSVPLYGVISNKQSVLLGRVFADGADSTFRISAPAGTRKVIIDPHETVLTAPN